MAGPTQYEDQRREVEYQPIVIETIDQAIYDWFDKTVDAQAPFPNGERRKVNIVLSAGERYAQKRKGIRDSNGVLIFPLISIRLTGIDPDPSMQALGTQTGKLTIAKRIDPKTNLLQDNIQRQGQNGQNVYAPGPGPVYQVTSIPFPDRNVFTYELVIQAQYVTQMNSILEKMIRELDIRKSFVGPFDNQNRHSLNGEDFETRAPLSGGYICGFFDQTLNDAGNFEEFTDQERIVRYNTTFRVPCTLQLDPEGERPPITVEKTAFGVKFGRESVVVVEDPLELDLIFGPRR